MLDLCEDEFHCVMEFMDLETLNSMALLVPNVVCSYIEYHKDRMLRNIIIIKASCNGYLNIIKIIHNKFTIYDKNIHLGVYK